MIIYDKDKKILFIPERDDVVLLEWKDIYQKGFRDGYDEGYDGAYGDAYQEGYDDGYASGIVSCHVDATSITLDVPSVIVGSGQADDIVEPADADVELIFTSSDPETATIDENENITVLDDGEVTFCVEDLETGLKDCKTVSVEVPVLSISPVFFENIPYSGATYVINVTANQPWSIINYYQDILTTDITGGTGNGVINVTVAPAGEGGVIADLIIHPQSGNEASAHFWQNPTPYFRVSPLSIEAAATGATYSIRVESNYDWEATNIPDWVSLSRTSGHSNADISAVVMENTGGTRTASIKFSQIETGATLEHTVVISQDSGATPPRQVRVQDLIAEGYANVVPPGGEYKAGTYIEILPTCPYLPDQITNLSDVALNQEEITAGTSNTIVWNQTLPAGWTDQDIVDIYSGQTISFPPRGEEFWDVKSGITSLELTFTGDSYVTSDYTWGSYNSEGVFAPRWNQNRQGEYITKGWLQTPATVIVNFTSSFSSVSQVMFTQMSSTSALTINQQSGTFACHDVTGMFEGDSALVTLNITGAFNYGTWRTQHNVFDGCTALTGIPYSTSWTREHANNTIYPHNDGIRGSANCHHMFRGCTSLTYLGPTFNMGAISLSGCTYDGQNQAALSSTLFECPVLADVRIINLNNNDWNFADSSTYTYIPAMNAASIEYLLNNVEDVTSQGGHTVTFHSRHMGEVSQSAIDAAAAKCWNVAWSTPDAS